MIPSRILAALDAARGVAQTGMGRSRRHFVAAAMAAALTLGWVATAEAQGRGGRQERAERLLAMGRAWLAAGDPGSATAYFRDATRVDPSDPDAYVALGRIYLDRGNPTDAIEALEAGLRWSPGHPALVRGKAEALEQAGDLAAAAGMWRTLVQSEPRDARAHLSRGRVARERGAWSEALTAYRAILDLAARGEDVPPETLTEAREYASALRVLVGSADPVSGGADCKADEGEPATAVRRALACD